MASGDCRVEEGAFASVGTLAEASHGAGRMTTLA
jgi:hypothetical protein